MTISTTVPVTTSTSRTACKVNAETFANPGMIHTTKYDATENHITEKWKFSTQSNISITHDEEASTQKSKEVLKSWGSSLARSNISTAHESIEIHGK